jgi:translation initiation factor IF-3
MYQFLSITSSLNFLLINPNRISKITKILQFMSYFFEKNKSEKKKKKTLKGNGVGIYLLLSFFL